MSTMAKKERELQQLLKRLVHVVVGSEENVSAPILGFFIEQTLLEIGDNQSQRRIAIGVKQIFLLDFLPQEVADALRELVQAGNLISTPDGRYCLETRRAQALKALNEETGQYEEKIFTEWAIAIRVKYPDISEDEANTLAADLRLYLNNVFLTHGAECAVLIYPEETRLRSLLSRSSVETFEEKLPKRSGRHAEIRLIEFPLFLKELSSNKKLYFAKILDGTFLYSLVQVDPNTQKFIRENFKNYRIFLDTNLIFALFDLRNPESTTSIGDILLLAKNFGIRVVVTQHTVEEMKSSIAGKRQALLESPQIDRKLAELAADVSEEENLVTAYWRAYYRTGITKQDFIDKFSHVSELLASKGIKIEKTQAFAENVIRKEVAGLQAAIRPQKKNKYVAAHDSYHRLLIQRFRAVAEAKQMPEKYWFMTLDGSLLVYDRKTRAKSESPFVMLPDQLLQILRRFGSRTADYDEVFFELFSRPQIKSAQGILPNNLVQKILAKMSGFQDLPPDVARSVILDQTFRKGVVDTAEDENALDTLILEKIDNALAAELKAANEKLGVAEEAREKERRLAKGELGKRNSENTFLRNLSFGLALTLLLLANIGTYLFVWERLNLLIKALLLAIDIGALYLVIRIRWKVSRAYLIIGAILAVVGFIFDVLS